MNKVEDEISWWFKSISQSFSQISRQIENSKQIDRQLAVGVFQRTLTFIIQASASNHQSFDCHSLSPTTLDNDENERIETLEKPVHVRQLPEWARNWSENVNGEVEKCLCLYKLPLARDKRRKNATLKLFSSYFLPHEALDTKRSTQSFFFAFVKKSPRATCKHRLRFFQNKRRMTTSAKRLS